MNPVSNPVRIMPKRALYLAAATVGAALLCLPSSPAAAQPNYSSATESTVAQIPALSVTLKEQRNISPPVVRGLRARIDNRTREIRASWKQPVGVAVKKYRVEVHRVTSTSHCLDGGFTKGRTLRYGPIKSSKEYQVRVWVITARGQSAPVVSDWLRLKR